MKTLAGLPISAFVAYSKMRKNTENPMIAKTMTKKQKQRVKLSKILPVHVAAPSTGNVSSAKQNLSLKHGRIKKKSKKRVKQTLPNGNTITTVALVSSESKKRSKAKTLTNGLPLDNSLNIGGSESWAEKVNPEIPETEEIPAVPSHESTPSQLKKKKVKSPVKNVAASSTTKQNKESQADESLEMEMPETMHKSLNNNPVEEGKSLFQWLIHPLSIDDFFKNNWERAPLQIKRSKSNYYKLLMSSPMLDSILRNYHILYTKNIDITSYSNGQRETHNPPGRALPSVVWDYYSNGCSIRMLNPQTFIPKLHALNATLQEFFGCFVGANSYLTPPNSQGFAPHYDDIEAFILQIEGKKRWRLYKPIAQSDYLPRYSSDNFDPTEIGEPILDTIVEAGDLLYFPRGTIHQGETIDDTHSLHITLSVYQKNSWCDFLEKLLPQALSCAITCDSRFREGLPLDYLSNIGYVNSSKDNEARRKFIEKSKELVCRLLDHIDIDGVADQMAKTHVHDFLPPVLSPQEQECSVLKDGERMNVAGIIENRVEIDPDTRIRLLRSHCIRLVEEKDCMKIYYSTENSKEYHEYEPQLLEVSKDLAPAVQEIIRRYPDFVKVDDLPIEGEDSKVQVARDLWEKCIVVTDTPLPIID